MFQRVVDEAVKENPDVSSWSKSEKHKKLVTFESTDDMEWLSYVFQETLRFQCPAT